MTYASALDESDLEAVVRHRLEAWGSERLRESLARSAGRSGCAGWREGGELAASLQHHRIVLRTPTGAQDALGISSVVTRADMRRRGFGSALVRAVVDESFAGGARIALLFSDIDTSLYERLGFQEASRASWAARLGALPSSSLHLRETDDIAALLAIHERSYNGEFLRIARTEASWRFFAWHNGAGRAHLVDEEAYVVCRLTDAGVLWIDDAASAGPPRETLWAAMRELAARAGAERIAGWLRPDQAGGPFVASARSRCVPMLAFSDPQPLPRSHFAWLDHF